MNNPAIISKTVVWGKELPDQLEIRAGKLVLKSNGETPTFDLPDGTCVNLLPHADAVKLIDDAKLWRTINMVMGEVA